MVSQNFSASGPYFGSILALTYVAAHSELFREIHSLDFDNHGVKLKVDAFVTF